MKKINGEVWPSEFGFEEKFSEEKGFNFSDEILEDSYKALNKIYQKEHKKNKVPKKAKQAWL